jgi:DNA (cytosine-5)-methyltransferase 1
MTLVVAPRRREDSISVPESYRVIDLFAGPGGLAEGFASLRPDGKRPFRIALSVEKETSAHRTLLLRSFLRQFEGRWPVEYDAFLAGGKEPDWALQYPEEWKAAEEHALLLELGTDKASEQLRPILQELAKGETIVIGGPPCQAYSVVGRNRNSGKKDYKASEDTRHFLYREYIEILKTVRPVAFVMENVKGLLSAKVDGEQILDLVLRDLRAAGGEENSYRLVALSPPMDDLFDSHEPTTAADFLIECEHFGVPQARHRMIIVGIRADHAAFLDSPMADAGPLLPRWTKDLANVEDALSGLPPLRSGLSRQDTPEAWRDTMLTAMNFVIGELESSESASLNVLHEDASLLAQEFAETSVRHPRQARRAVSMDETCPKALRDWLEGRAGGRLANHDSRSHMPSDLARYFFSAVFTRRHNRSPRAEEFPEALAPDHANWESGKFVDRFRVQRKGRPATTITSHISKDGHYFIHPDPLQCRALTVREAARLQTFPDDYLFLGNRTQQFVQVGNAVPPFIARQIGEALLKILSHTQTARD